MPGWVMVLEAAKEWSIPPWQVEDEASVLWWQRWQVLREETARARKNAADKATERAEQEN